MVKWFRINRITLWQSPSWKRIFNFLGISHSTYFYHCFDQLDIIQLGQKDENLELVFVFILQTWAIKSSDGFSRTVQNILTKSVDLNRKSIFEVVINWNQQLVKQALKFAKKYWNIHCICPSIQLSVPYRKIIFCSFGLQVKYVNHWTWLRQQQCNNYSNGLKKVFVLQTSFCQTHSSPGWCLNLKLSVRYTCRSCWH